MNGQGNGSGAGVGVLAVLTEAESWLPLDHYEDERFHERYLQAVKAIESAMALPEEFRKSAQVWSGIKATPEEWQEFAKDILNNAANKLEAALGPAPPATDADAAETYRIAHEAGEAHGRLMAKLEANRATPPAGGGDGMLPDELVPLSKEWYVLCERRFAVDRISISGELAEAIVASVGRLASGGGARVGQDWQPIETAPKDGRELILLLTPSRHPQVAFSNTWWTAGFSVECKPTHWAPIPTLPSAPTPETQG